jgi:hypothetical protein
MFGRKIRSALCDMGDEIVSLNETIDNHSHKLDESLSYIKEAIAARDAEIKILKDELHRRSLFIEQLLLEMLKAQMQQASAPKPVSAVAEYLARKNAEAAKSNGSKSPRLP